MNLQHFIYAVEVEKTGSITQAAQNLYMNQPHLSKSIRELEDDFGIKIFNRTSKGVIPTKQGATFLAYAKKVLSQIEEMKSLYAEHNNDCLKFNICVPRTSYISYALTKFLKNSKSDIDIDVNYRETNTFDTIKNITEGINNLGIIRYQTKHEDYFKELLCSRKLYSKEILEFEYLALMSQSHPLSDKNILEHSDLSGYTEITHGDLSIPFVSTEDLEKTTEHKKSIAIYERGSQFEILSRIPSTYMWVSPIPDDILKNLSLVQKKCKNSTNKQKDVLIYKSKYVFSNEDKLFLKCLDEAVSEVSKIYNQN